MRRGQSTLEFVFLIGVVAVATTAMLVYMKRGFQGNIRSSAEQIGAGQYEPGSTTIDNSETKHLISKIISESNTTTKYGNGGVGSTLQDNLDQQNQLKADLTTLGSEKINATVNQTITKAAAAITAGITAADKADMLAPVQKAILDTNGQLIVLQTDHATLWSQYVALYYKRHRTPDEEITMNNLFTALTNNESLQVTVNGTLNDLKKQEQDLQDGKNIVIDTSTLTPKKKADMLVSADKAIGEMNRLITALPREYAKLQAEYTTLQKKPHRTGTDEARMLELGGNIAGNPTLQAEYDTLRSKPDPTGADEARMLVLGGEMGKNQRQQETANNTLSILVGQKEALVGGKSIVVNIPAVTVTTRTLADINADIAKATVKLSDLVKAYKVLLTTQNSLVIGPDTTTSTSSNTEEGTITIDKHIDEKLGNL